MESYSGFAEVYDTFMDNVPYEAWGRRIVKCLNRFGITPVKEEEQIGLSELEKNLYEEKHTVLDLGCGTGVLTRALAEEGYSMIGIDASADMLEIAREAEMEYMAETGSMDGILYLEQDMRQLELFGTVGAVVSVCDCINYLLEDKDVVETFLRVNNYLYPGGLFLFDFNTVHKYRDVIGDAVIAENREDCSFIWENYYHAEKEINEYELTIFVRADEDTAEDNPEGKVCDGERDAENGEDAQIPFYRMKETHYQRGYTLEQMIRFLEEAGLTFVEAFDSDTEKAVTENTERIFVIAREAGKAVAE